MTFHRGFVGCAVLALMFGAMSFAEDRWRSLGPFGGDVFCFAIGPSPEGVVYAGTGSGIFRSDDGGESWRFSGLAGERVLSLAVDPRTADTAYAGIDAEEPGSGGVFKTTDGGVTWIPVRVGLEDPKHEPDSPWFMYRPVNALLVDPHDPGTVWAGLDDRGGLQRSTNEGAEWSSASLPGDVLSIAANPLLAEVLYVSVDHGRGISRSIDGGNTWSLIAEDVLKRPADDPNIPSVRRVAIAPTDPHTMYAVTSKVAIKSNDGGDSWRVVVDIQAMIKLSARLVDVGVHPEDRDIAWVVTFFHGIYVTNDGGVTWAQVGEGLECPMEDFGITHKRPKTLVVSPVHRRLFLGAQREGVFVKPLGGGAWEESTSGLSATRATSLTCDPHGLSALLAATRGLGVFRSENGGDAWESANTGGGNECGPIDFLVKTSGPIPYCRSIRDVLWSEGGGPILTASECGVAGSRDRGRSWDEALGSSWIDTIAAAPSDADIVYASWGFGSGTRFSMSVDGGVNWSQCPGLADIRNVRSLAVSPEDPTTVYAGSRLGLYVSRDVCTSWTGPVADIDDGCPSGDSTDVSVVAFAPVGPEVVFAGTECGVFVSADDGDSWIHRGLEGMRVSTLAFDGPVVYAGTPGDGVWVSRDLGESWTAIDGPLNRNINKLTVDSRSRRLYASTEGNGVFVLELPARPPRRSPGRLRTVPPAKDGLTVIDRD
jgi:photosystem II stability/assembly factor-like uncharacterized protein